MYVLVAVYDDPKTIIGANDIHFCVFHKLKENVFMINTVYHYFICNLVILRNKNA